MKNFFIVLLIGFSAMLLVGLSANAAKLRLGSDGSVTVVNDTVTYSLPEVVVSQQAAQYPNALKSAYESPGTKVPVVTKDILERNDLFHIEKVTTVLKAMVYDTKAKTITVVDDNAIVSKTEIVDTSAVLGAVYLVLMMMMFVLPSRFIASISAIFATFAAVFSAIFATVLSIPFFVLVFSAFIVTMFAADGNKDKFTRWASTVGIILMLTALALNYFLV